MELSDTLEVNGFLTSIGRRLRFLASFGTVKEVSEDHFAATNITRTLTVPRLKVGIYHKRGGLRLNPTRLPTLTL